MKKIKYILIGAILIFFVIGSNASIAIVKNNKDILKNEINRAAELDITTDENLYYIGDTITIYFTNVGDETLSGGGPILSYYNSEDELIYQEGAYGWYELEPGEYFTWTWNQKNFSDEQVPMDKYKVEGLLSGVDKDYIDYSYFFILDYELPDPPFGPEIGVINFDYTFYFDIPGNGADSFYIMWDYGDEAHSEWLGPYIAGDRATTTYSWSQEGFYELRLKIKDDFGNEYWTDSLIIHIYDNNPPSAPIINGPENGEPEIIYEYTFMAIDPESDQVYYYIDWGDGNKIEWDGPHSSSEPIRFSHIWEDKGRYVISAQSKDIYNAVGEWSELNVNMPRAKIRNSLFTYLIDYHPNLIRLYNLIFR